MNAHKNLVSEINVDIPKSLLSIRNINTKLNIKIDEIASERNIPFPKMKEQLEDFTLKEPLRINAKFDIEKEKDIVKMYINGYKSVREIADEFNCSHQCVCDILERYNVERKRKKHKHKEKFSDEKKEKIIRLYNDGKSYVDIAKEIGCSSTAISKFIKNSGVKQRACGTTLFFPEQINEMRYMYLQEEYTTVEIAKKFGCATTTINNIFKKNNIPLKKKHWR